MRLFLIKCLQEIGFWGLLAYVLYELKLLFIVPCFLIYVIAIMFHAVYAVIRAASREWETEHPVYYEGPVSPPFPKSPDVEIKGTHTAILKDLENELKSLYAD